MRTWWHGNAVCITGHLWGESTVDSPHKWPMKPWWVVMGCYLCQESAMSTTGCKSADRDLDKLIQLTLLYQVDTCQWFRWCLHEDIITWYCFLNNWPFVRGIHQWPLVSPHKKPAVQALIFSVLLTWEKCWAKSQVACDLRHHDTHVTLL